MERRKNRELQETSREREKEYQKLKAAHDKFKRKALFTTNSAAADNANGGNMPVNMPPIIDQTKNKKYGHNLARSLDVGAVVGGMEANGIQRTPFVNRSVVPGPIPQSSHWAQQPQYQRNTSYRQSFAVPTDRSQRSGYVSDCSDSANEVENILMQHPRQANAVANYGNWQAGGQRSRPRGRNGMKPAL
ncbi:hypothetical protein AX17_000901 [Amanita inopinata Kibby_2008]|nr:hypothetical protein AX17_000901 [Amanita inopinata Kibby_2008]